METIVGMTAIAIAIMIGLAAVGAAIGIGILLFTCYLLLVL